MIGASLKGSVCEPKRDHRCSLVKSNVIGKGGGRMCVAEVAPLRDEHGSLRSPERRQLLDLFKRLSPVRIRLVKWGRLGRNSSSGDFAQNLWRPCKHAYFHRMKRWSLFFICSMSVRICLESSSSWNGHRVGVFLRLSNLSHQKPTTTFIIDTLRSPYSCSLSFPTQGTHPHL